jgi:hypothetical protein
MNDTPTPAPVPCLVLSHTHTPPSLPFACRFETGPGSSQYNFMDKALGSVNRSVTPWVFVMGHRPMYYLDNVPTGGQIDQFLVQFEPLLVQHQVDIFFAGHVHNVYSSCPMINGTCITPPSPGAYDAPIHICIGNAGQGLTPLNATATPRWTTFAASVWGYSTIEVFNNTDMAVNLFADNGNALLHQVNIHRER